MFRWGVFPQCSIKFSFYFEIWSCLQKTNTYMDRVITSFENMIRPSCTLPLFSFKSLMAEVFPGKRQGTPQTSRHPITGLTCSNKQSFTHTCTHLLFRAANQADKFIFLTEEGAQRIPMHGKEKRQLLSWGIFLGDECRPT